MPNSVQWGKKREEKKKKRRKVGDSTLFYYRCTCLLICPYLEQQSEVAGYPDKFQPGQELVKSSPSPFEHPPPPKPIPVECYPPAVCISTNTRGEGGWPPLFGQSCSSFWGTGLQSPPSSSHVNIVKSCKLLSTKSTAGIYKIWPAAILSLRPSIRLHRQSDEKNLVKSRMNGNRPYFLQLHEDEDRNFPHFEEGRRRKEIKYYNQPDISFARESRKIAARINSFLFSSTSVSNS